MLWSRSSVNWLCSNLPHRFDMVPLPRVLLYHGVVFVLQGAFCLSFASLSCASLAARWLLFSLSDLFTDFLLFLARVASRALFKRSSSASLPSRHASSASLSSSLHLLCNHPCPSRCPHRWPPRISIFRAYPLSHLCHLRLVVASPILDSKFIVWVFHPQAHDAMYAPYAVLVNETSISL